MINFTDYFRDTLGQDLVKFKEILLINFSFIFFLSWTYQYCSVDVVKIGKHSPFFIHNNSAYKPCISMLITYGFLMSKRFRPHITHIYQMFERCQKQATKREWFIKKKNGNANVKKHQNYQKSSSALDQL